MHEIVIEKFLAGKCVDVGQLTNSGWACWEVMLENSVRDDLLVDMVQKDLRAGFVHVIIVVQSRKDMEKVFRVIRGMESEESFRDLGKISEKVTARLLADFLNNRSKEV